jgi:polysaccharide export outer membrane protein
LHMQVSSTLTWSRFTAALSLLVGLALLGGCQSMSQKIGQFARPSPALAASAPQPAQPTEQLIPNASLTYQLQPGDVVDVKFYYNADLNEQLVIGPDGKVALQLIGEVNTAGLSPAQLATLLTQRYSSMLRKPDATVILRKYALPRIYVAGEVINPSAHALDAGALTALQAIIQSGGFKHGAERHNVIVLRHSGTGQPTFIKVDLQAHLEQTAQSDLPLKPYDIVFVPQRRIAEVADFFDEYVGKIIPLYRNMGLSLNYNLKSTERVIQDSTVRNVTP